MRTNLIVVDDFYDHPDAVRAYALRQPYYYPYQPDADVRSGRVAPKWMASWFREAAACPFKSSPSLIAKLEAITGDTIDREHWSRSFPVDAEGKAAADCERVLHSCLWNCCFHLKPRTEQQLGEGVHNHVTDIWNGVGTDGWAGLLYLAPDAPLGAGLKLWRNRDPARNHDWMTPKENWELIDDIGNVYNRLILTRGSTPHSGAAGWGDTLENGRLYQTFFFQVSARRPLGTLQIAGVDA